MGHWLESNHDSARKITTQRVSVKEVPIMRSEPILEGTLKAPGCNTFRARARVSRGMQDLHNHKLSETTRHMSSCAGINREDAEKDNTHGFCTTASLQRVKASRWQLQTGADGRSVRSRRRKTTSRQTREQDNCTK